MMLEKDLVEESQVKNAVEAVLQLIKLTEKSSVSLTDESKNIDLLFILNKAPLSRKRIKLDLPHSLDEDAREVCIFVKDLDSKDREYEKTVYHYQALFKEKGITRISKIIPLKALRTDYCQPDSKRALLKAYDLFLCDASIKSFLPALLGKIFYDQKKNIPRQIKFENEFVKEQIDRTIDNPVLEVSGMSSMCNLWIGHDKMETKEITLNTMQAIRSIAEKIPGGRNNIRTISMKTQGCFEIPLYMNYVNPGDIILPEKKKEKLATYIDDVTTVEGGLVSVRADGVIRIIKNKPEPIPDDDGDGEEVKEELDIKEEDNGIGGSEIEKTKLKGKDGGKTKRKKDKKGDNLSSDAPVKKQKANKRKQNGGNLITEGSVKEDKDFDIVEIKEENSDDEETVTASKKRRKRKRSSKKNDALQDEGSSSDVIEIKEEIKEEVLDEASNEKKKKMKKNKKFKAANKQSKGKQN